MPCWGNSAMTTTRIRVLGTLALILSLLPSCSNEGPGISNPGNLIHNTQWLFTRYDSSDGVSRFPYVSDSISLVFFTDSLLYGEGRKCPNSYDASYKIDKFGGLQLGVMRSTLVGCNHTFFWQYLDALQIATGIEFAESHLYLYINHTAQRLVYDRKLQ